ncbi:MAG: DMT family transporter [Anaerolineales bacterium]|nr:DMT family transporter [Anaerolineales bacterium]
MRDKATPLTTPAASPATWRSWTVALLSTVCFSIGPVLAQLAYAAGVNPNTLLFLRFLLTIALLFVTLLIAGREKLWMDRRGLIITVGGGLATGVSMLAYFWSLTRLETSIASMIFSVYPLAVLGLLALRGERFTHRHTVRLALALIGVYLLIGPGGAVDGLGVLLVVVSILAASLQSVFVQWYLQEYDGIAVTLYTVIGIQIVVAGFWWWQGGDLTVPDWRGWAAIIALAVVSTYLSRIFWFAAIKGIGGGQTAMLVPLEVLLTVVWSFVFLGERLTGQQWFGGALILLSALLAWQRLQRVRVRTRPSSLSPLSRQRTIRLGEDDLQRKDGN